MQRAPPHSLRGSATSPSFPPLGRSFLISGDTCLRPASPVSLSPDLISLLDSLSVLRHPYACLPPLLATYSNYSGITLPPSFPSLIPSTNTFSFYLSSPSLAVCVFCSVACGVAPVTVVLLTYSPPSRWSAGTLPRVSREPGTAGPSE